MKYKSLTKEQLDLTEYFVSGDKLVANVIYAAIICKKHSMLPHKIETIVEKVTEIYKREFEKCAESFYIRTFKTCAELEKWLRRHILPIQEIQDLNLSQNEYERGVTVNDPNRRQYVFTSRYSAPCSEQDDFIDLDAYIRNLTHYLARENIEIAYNTF